MQIVITTYNHQYWKFGLYQGAIVDVYEGAGAQYPRPDKALWVKCPKGDGYTLIAPEDCEVFVEE